MFNDLVFAVLLSFLICGCLGQSEEVTQDDFNVEENASPELRHETRSAVHNLAYSIACYEGRSLNLGNTLRVFGKYARYGCWCGFGGSGRTVDKIDKCCKGHDLCLINYAGWRGKPNVDFSLNTFYSATCKNRRTTCAATTTLGLRTCQCDRTFAACANRHKRSWSFFHSWIFARRNC